MLVKYSEMGVPQKLDGLFDGKAYLKMDELAGPPF
jgi:hypothetical protein